MRRKIGLHLIALASASLVTTANATGPGFFLGLQAGQSNVYAKPANFEVPVGSGNIVSVKPSNTGFGFRMYMGYNFTSYAAMEGGLSKYTSANYSFPGGHCKNPAVYGFDIVGKGLVPISVVSIFAKAGIAILKTTGLSSVTSSGKPKNACGLSGEEVSSSSVRPLVGAGISYDLNQNWVVDLSWTRIMKGSSNQNTDLKSLGFSYHFVDKYCGQFLC